MADIKALTLDELSKNMNVLNDWVENNTNLLDGMDYSGGADWSDLPEEDF